MSSGISESSGSGSGSATSQLQNRDFKILLDVKSGGPQVTVHLVAPTIQVSIIYHIQNRHFYHHYCNIKINYKLIFKIIFFAFKL